MSQQESESADPSEPEARAPLPGFPTDRLTWIGLGALASAVLIAVACLQPAWNRGETHPRTAAVKEPFHAGKTVPSTPAASDFPPTLPRGRAADSAVNLPRQARRIPDPERDRTVPVPAQRPTGSAGGTSHARSGTFSSHTVTPSTGSHPRNPSNAWALSASASPTTENNQYWDQDTVTVRSTAPLTALKVTVRIIQTGGVSDSGVWTSLGDKVSVRSAADSEQLAYVVTLKPGITLNAGTYTFQFGFNHDPGTREASHDLYVVTATSAESGSSQSRSGHI